VTVTFYNSVMPVQCT